jgi:hypothetical protein
MVQMVAMGLWIINDSDIDFDDDDIELFSEDSKTDSLVGRLLKKEFVIPTADLDNGSDGDDGDEDGDDKGDDVDDDVDDDDDDDDFVDLYTNEDDSVDKQEDDPNDLFLTKKRKREQLERLCKKLCNRPTKLNSGCVVGFEPEMQYYQILYEDSDREELEHHELLPLLD